MLLGCFTRQDGSHNSGLAKTAALSCDLGVCSTLPGERGSSLCTETCPTIWEKNPLEKRALQAKCSSLAPGVALPVSLCWQGRQLEIGSPLLLAQRDEYSVNWRQQALGFVWGWCCVYPLLVRPRRASQANWGRVLRRKVRRCQEIPSQPPSLIADLCYCGNSAGRESSCQCGRVAGGAFGLPVGKP